MTCIVGLVDDGTVYLGGDSAGIGGGWDLSLRSDPKVFGRLGPDSVPWVFGFTTSFRMGQLLRYELQLPALLTPAVPSSEELFATIVRSFIPALRTCLKDGGWAEREKEREEGGAFLVGTLHRLFRIDSDYQVQETLDGYDAVGCGSGIALGSLATSSDGEPFGRLKHALLAAEHHSGGVRGPFNFVDTAIA